MKLPRSIRWRIQVWHGLLLLGLVTAASIFIYRIESANADQLADYDLRSALMQVLGRMRQNRPPGPLAQPPPERPPAPPPLRLGDLEARFGKGRYPVYFVVWGREGQVLHQSAGMPPDEREPQALIGPPMVARSHNGYREEYSVTPAGACVLVGQSMDAVRQHLRRFALNLALLGFGVMALGLTVGLWIAARALQPVRDIGAAAARISAGNLAARINVRENESELGQLAAVLNDMFARLEEAFAHEARFSSDAAHELRTPVSVILAQTELAIENKLDAGEQRELALTCRRAAQRMHNLIESLLELAAVEGHPQNLNRQTCDLANVARDAMEIMRLLASERRISLKGDLAPAPCNADSERILQVALNLLTNAFKFSPAGAEVRVTARTENGEALLTVADTGPGIGAEHLPHIFERFYRVDASRARSTGGLGLGLAICESIVQAHGGTMAVASGAGEGAAFTVHIPRK